jgi:hypothetical protein
MVLDCNVYVELKIKFQQPFVEPMPRGSGIIRRLKVVGFFRANCLKNLGADRDCDAQ